VAGRSGHGNITVGAINCQEFHDQLSDYQFLEVNTYLSTLLNSFPHDFFSDAMMLR
jgi:hypothetical protein